METISKTSAPEYCPCKGTHQQNNNNCALFRNFLNQCALGQTYYILPFIDGNENILFQSEVHDTSEDKSNNINSSDTSDNLADGNSGKASITKFIL